MGSLTPAEKDCRDRAGPDRAPAMVDRNSKLDLLGSPEGEGSHPAPFGCSVKPPDRWNGTTRISSIQPLSVEAVEFSPALVPEQKLLYFRLIVLPICITHIYTNTFISVFLGDSTHVVGYRINYTVSH